MRFLALTLLLMSCASSHEGLSELTLSSDTRTLTLWVEIADDPPEQTQGLMGRKELGKDEGMLFLFPEERRLSFWMKNTLIPLDILFFDARGNLVNVQTMDPCAADPCKTYPSAELAKYALEVNAGLIEKEGVGEGWRMSGAGLLPARKSGTSGKWHDGPRRAPKNEFARRGAPCHQMLLRFFLFLLP